MCRERWSFTNLQGRHSREKPTPIPSKEGSRTGRARNSVPLPGGGRGGFGGKAPTADWTNSAPGIPRLRDFAGRDKGVSWHQALNMITRKFFCNTLRTCDGKMPCGRRNSRLGAQKNRNNLV